MLRALFAIDEKWATTARWARGFVGARAAGQGFRHIGHGVDQSRSMLLAFICMNVLCCRRRRRSSSRSVLQERRCHRLIERASERSRETHTHTKPSVSNSSRCTITILCYTHTSCSNAKPLTTTRMARWRTIHDASKALSSSSSKLTNDPAISMDLAIYPLANLCLYACDGSSAAAASNKWSPSFCALQGTTTYIHLRRIDYLRTTAITTRHSQGCQARSSIFHHYHCYHA